MSKVYTSFQSLPDLRKSKNSVTNIILNNFSRFEDCKTKDDVIELCHELFDNANLDTAWTRQFFYNLSQLKNRDEAVLYVGNVYFKGAGLGMSRGKRVYEDEELNEASIHDYLLPRVEYHVLNKYDKPIEIVDLTSDDHWIGAIYPYIGTGKAIMISKVSPDQQPLTGVVYVDGKEISRNWREAKPILDQVRIRTIAVNQRLDNLRKMQLQANELNESMDSDEAVEFKKKLSAGEVKFKYMKKDGSERTAVGTLDPKLMNLPEKKTSSDIDNAAAKQKKARKLPADSVFYYDLEAKGFRSFKMSNFIDYV